MQNQLATVRNFLAGVIKEAELRETGRHSLMDFAARVRRDTAKEILDFVQSLPAEGMLPRDRGSVLRHGREPRVEMPGLSMGVAPAGERTAALAARNTLS